MQTNQHLAFSRIVPAEVSSNQAVAYKEEISVLYDLYAPSIYGTLLSWVGEEGVAQMILEQTFSSYINDHLSTECKHAKPFICMLRIARKKYNSYLVTGN